MTEKEAITAIINHMEFCEQKGEGYLGETLESLKTAISSLEKQIPKKPTRSNHEGWYFCPNCFCAIKQRIEDSKHDIKFCPFCGQALNWEDIMTDSEIIKALEDAIDTYKEKGVFVDTKNLQQQALDLLKRQKKEIETIQSNR